MRIDSLYLRDIGPFEEVRLDFPRGTDDSLADVYLLTGENGCGKSTILYAIAFLLGVENSVRKRIRGARWEARLVAGDRQSFRSRSGHNDRLSAPMSADAPLRWAAFAYSGAREVTSGSLSAIKELDRDPLEGCLSFHQTANTQHLAQWIAGQDYKRLKAKDAGRVSEAESYRSDIADIERAIGLIIEDPTFRFIPRLTSLGIDVQRRGSVVDLDLLPDGLKSIVSWVADLLMRLERTPWVDDVPPREREFLLLLDEIDIHLHPAWQRRILPMVQRLFPKAQIIATTHSPFVVASADDAQIIRFNLVNGVSTVDPTPRGSQIGSSVATVLRDVFDVTSEFDIDTERLLAQFYSEKRAVLAGEASDRVRLDDLGKTIASRSEELSTIIGFELRQLDRLLAAPKHAAG